ncbi:hypothetical protein LSH36_330g11018 [Paralvinella palmiformis]|uniref:HAT C-terminal dimerisation domain-containing protein n=1 Tax=Paralvinella palmiformis TaxID=53620 RepID=A0AAD9JHR9_9ANNE|nr:hypothetical protein LSH36_330g11018 [Paralvinella palmiformis]
MLRSVVKIPQDVLNSLEYSGKPTAYDMKNISELCEVLLPFEEATDAVQGELVVTSSTVLICIRGLRAEMQRLRDIYSSRLVATLQAGIEKRLARYEEMDDFKQATKLDPRFKLDWCQNDESREVRDLLTSKVVQLSPTTLAEDNDHTSPEPKRSRLMNFMANRAPPSTTTQSSSDMEVTSYLSQPSLPQDSKPLIFWKENKVKYLILSKLASKYLAIPSSSAPIERLFSITGKVFRPELCRLTDKRFEELMIVRYNKRK